MAVSKPIAQKFDAKERTEDVLVWGDGSNVSFDNLNVPELILEGLVMCGFQKASPVQAVAIPVGLHKTDMIIQAKSGTGKACAFSVIALSVVDQTKSHCQVVVINPTRELACQNTYVIAEIGQKLEGLQVETLIGSTPVWASVQAASKCHVAVGTPGRLAQLVRDDALDLTECKLVLLDEADVLTEKGMIEDVELIIKAAGPDKQVVAVSATFPPCLDFILSLMKDPQKVILDNGDPVLTGSRNVILDIKRILEMRENIVPSESFESKFKCLSRVVANFEFQQCLIFCNSNLRADYLYQKLVEHGFDVELMCARKSQKERAITFKSMREGAGKLFVCTDLCARGLDVEGVDLVLNFELPYDVKTYFHRAGRAGRFGSVGVIMSLVAIQSEARIIQEYQVMHPQLLFRTINSVESLADVRDVRKVLKLPIQERNPTATHQNETENGMEELESLMKWKSEQQSLLSLCTSKVTLPHITASLLTDELQSAILSFQEEIQITKDEIKQYLEEEESEADFQTSTGPKYDSETNSFSSEKYYRILKDVTVEPLVFIDKL